MLAFIVNPGSGLGKGYRVWKHIKEYLDKKKIAYQLHITEKSGCAKDFARELSNMESEEEIRLIIIGGSGTVNEVLEGILISDRLVLAHIPTGFSNDLAKGMRLENSPIKALKRILKQKEVGYVDYGVMNWGESKHRRFLVSSGIGLDGEVAKYMMDLKKHHMGETLCLPCRIKSIFHICSMIFKEKPRKGYIILDGIKKVEFNSIIFISSNIHPYNSGVRIAPKANNRDGELSVCIIHQRSKLKLLNILFRALWGNHLKYSGVRTYECRELEICLEEVGDVHTDGEYLGSCDRLEVCCIHNKLKFII